MYYVSVGCCIYRTNEGRLQGFAPWLPITWTDMGVPDGGNSLYRCEDGTLEVIEKCFSRDSLCRRIEGLEGKVSQASLSEEGVYFCLGL